MAIQSLSICCPSATGKCINHCKTCTARQHTNPYENKYDSRCKVDTFQYWEDVKKRMEYALRMGCQTLMLTGSNEPQQNRRWIETLYHVMQSLPEKFVNIEIQTTGAFLDQDYVQFLKLFGVTTIAISAFNIFDDKVNIEIEESADANLKLANLCSLVKKEGMNLRLCLNVTDYLTDSACRDNVDLLLDRCAYLGANQVTFRKMWSGNPETPEAIWISENCRHSDQIIHAIKNAVQKDGSLLNRLPYGAARYDYMGFSIVIDTDSMAKDETNEATKYYIIREDGKMYSSWDSKASIVF